MFKVLTTHNWFSPLFPKAEELFDLKLGYPDVPEMNPYRHQLQQFMQEWEEVNSGLTFPYSVLEIGGKSPEDLLQEMIVEMQSEYDSIKLILNGPISYPFTDLAFCLQPHIKIK